jgi:hypothetical protein
MKNNSEKLFSQPATPRIRSSTPVEREVKFINRFWSVKQRKFKGTYQTVVSTGRKTGVRIKLLADFLQKRFPGFSGENLFYTNTS